MIANFVIGRLEYSLDLPLAPVGTDPVQAKGAVPNDLADDTRKQLLFHLLHLHLERLRQHVVLVTR